MVTVTVTNKKGSAVGVHALTLYPPPEAGFDATPTAGVAPLEVTFSNTSTGFYSSSLWDFGDAITSTLESPVHTYRAAGAYTVTLTAGGPGGTDVKAQPAVVTVYAPVVAGFTAEPLAGVSPLAVSFTNTSTGDYDASLWGFGDGVTSTLESPIHTYEAPGVYTVTLGVEGLGGSDVESKPAPVTVYAPVQAAALASLRAPATHPLTVVFTEVGSLDP